VVVASVLDEELESRSKSLFGNRHMLHVAREIASRGRPFTVQEVSKKTGVPYSSTHRLMRQLEKVGLLEPAPPKQAEQHRWYRRPSHRFWGAVQQLCASEKQQGSSKGVRDA